MNNISSCSFQNLCICNKLHTLTVTTQKTPERRGSQTLRTLRRIIMQSYIAIFTATPKRQTYSVCLSSPFYIKFNIFYERRPPTRRVGTKICSRYCNCCYSKILPYNHRLVNTRRDIFEFFVKGVYKTRRM